MGNASMVQTGIVRVTGKGEVTLEMNFQSMQFAGMTGYLYKLKKSIWIRLNTTNIIIR